MSADQAMTPYPGEQAAAELAPVVPSPQYARGFEGMATEPFPEAARKVLAEPVNPHDVEIKPDGIVFLPGVAYRRILTRAFGAGGWALAPRGPARVMGNVVVYPGALFALGRFVSEAVGECFYREGNANMSYASCVEGAKTDCLSRCCKDLGIAAEMWDANWREEWKAKYATSYRGKKWDAKKQAEVESTAWKLKARVSNPHDLMAGAGGVAPAVVPPSPPARSPSPQGTASSGYDGGAEAAEPPPPEDEIFGLVTPPASDTGEPASDEQKQALIDQVKRLRLTGGYLKIWMYEVFGLRVTDPKRSFEALSQVQADAALTLLIAHGTEMYGRLLGRWRETGSLADRPSPGDAPK